MTHWLKGIHDDVIKWKHFPRYWPFVRGIHRSPMNSLHNFKPVTRSFDVFFVCVNNSVKPSSKSMIYFYIHKISCRVRNCSCRDSRPRNLTTCGQDPSLRLINVPCDCVITFTHMYIYVHICVFIALNHNQERPINIAHNDGLTQDYSKSIANALELLQFWTKPSI